MRRFIVLLTIGAATVIAGSATAAPPSVQILIHHQVKGCHAWAVGNGVYKATQNISAVAGTKFTVTDSDLMPHLLYQASGPKVTLHTPNMNKADAQASFRLLRKGTYVFKTKAGEDWVKGVKTSGPDNVLKLIVVVK